MAYDLPWGAAHPGHLVYLLDFSDSMKDDGKIDILLDVLKMACLELFYNTRNLIRGSISIIGYNSDVATLFKGTLGELYNEYEQGGGRNYSLLDKTKSLAEGGCRPEWQTYTAKAFRWAKSDIEEWIAEQERAGKRIPAPMVIHVTDGYPYDEERTDSDAKEDALKAAQEIMNISIPDGSPLIFNIHIGDDSSREVLFPTQRPSEENQQFLYDASSIMPAWVMLASRGMPATGGNARTRIGLPVSNGCRLMALNVINRELLERLIHFGSTLTSLL